MREESPEERRKNFAASFPSNSDKLRLASNWLVKDWNILSLFTHFRFPEEVSPFNKSNDQEDILGKYFWNPA